MKFERFEKSVLLLVAVVGSVVTIATYRHSVAYDREQEEAQARQAREALNANMRMPMTLPNLNRSTARFGHS